MEKEMEREGVKVRVKENRMKGWMKGRRGEG